MFDIARAQSPDNGEAVNEMDNITPLVVGQKVPDKFWTEEHLFYVDGDTVRRTLEQYKGKMLVLDFWMIGCVKCFIHQKEINYYKRNHKDELAVILVNGLKTKNNYLSIRRYLTEDRLFNLGLTSFSSIIENVFLDKLFDPAGYPMYYWINKYGVLQTVSYRNLLDQNYVAPFLD